MKSTLAVLALGCTAALIAQQKGTPEPPTKAIYASKADIAAGLDKGGPATQPRAHMISRYTDHLVAGGRRDAPADAEMHEKAYDIIYMTEGEATYVSGGTLKNSKQTGPGEYYGGTIEGGETHTMKAGDVIVVPPGVPHWWKDAKGARYMIMKINK